MVNYTQDSNGDEVPITRGHAYPAGGQPWEISLSRTDAFNDGEETWTWKMRLDESALGGTADLVVTADSATLSDTTTLVLKFTLSDTETESLPGSGRGTLLAELAAVDGSGNEYVWPSTRGTVTIQDAVGAAQ